MCAGKVSVIFLIWSSEHWHGYDYDVSALDYCNLTESTF